MESGTTPGGGEPTRGAGSAAWLLGGILVLAGILGVAGAVLFGIDRISDALDEFGASELLEAALWVIVAGLALAAFGAVAAAGRRVMVKGSALGRGETIHTAPRSQFDPGEDDPRRPG